MRSLSDIAFSIFRDRDLKRGLEEELIRHRYQDQKSDYSDVRAPRTDKHGGYITIDSRVVAQTQQCGHCGCHWVVRTGSGTNRTICRGCMKLTCGAPACFRCVTWEEKMRQIERRMKR